jgi:membrane protease YdiL (CAAX protease family)
VTAPVLGYWLRVVAETGVALALLLAATPPPVAGHVSWPPGIGLAVLAGVVLALALAGRMPSPRRIGRARIRIVAAKAGVLAVAAAGEEVVWRWFAIGALAPAVGLGPALGASTGAFALAHVGQGIRAVPVHVVTGASFGAVFLATGSLLAAAVAHATYNVTILFTLESARARSSVAPSGVA